MKDNKHQINIKQQRCILCWKLTQNSGNGTERCAPEVLKNIYNEGVWRVDNHSNLLTMI